MKLHMVLLKMQLLFLSCFRMLIEIAELKPGRFRFFKKNSYFSFICLKSVNLLNHNEGPLKQINKKSHSLRKSEEQYSSTHLLTTCSLLC